MNETSDVTSPITGGGTRLIETIEVKEIVKMYKDIDVSRYFHGISKIKLLECNDTKYKFFYPFDITGDEKYYGHLSKNDWYYMPWKWEHEIAIKEIHKGDEVLEIGCGNGDFLKHCTDMGANCVGVEMNQEAISECGKKKIKVINGTLEKFEGIEGKFNVVCAFQVLEHVPEVKIFISQAIKMLKRGGKLIFAVPNNSSFIRKDHHNILNIPPHHMGLWDKESLINISKYFDLKIVKIMEEPLQKYHVPYYFNVTMGDKIDIPTKMGMYIKRLYGFIFRKIIYVLRKKITGHTILVIYVKN